VDDLRPDNVTVIDADGKIPVRSSRRQQGVGHDEIEEMEHSLSEKLVATLTPIVGPEGLRANVTIEYDLASSDSTQETYDPNGSVVLTSQISEDSAADSDSEGAPGTPSNVPGSSAQGAASAALDNAPGQVGQRTEHKTFAVSKTFRHAVQPPGGIKRVAAAVLVDYAVDTRLEGDRKVEARRRRSEGEMKQIEELAKAAIGFDPVRGDRISVQNISFTPDSTAGGRASLPESLAPMFQQLMGAIRYIGLAALFCAVYLLILRPVKKQIVATFAAGQPQLPAGSLVQELLGKPNEPVPELKQKAVEGEVVGGDALDELTGVSAEIKRTLVLRKQLVDRIKKDPEGASRLIQNWVSADEAQT
jgi:flagellar M-ring protein FliF